MSSKTTLTVGEAADAIEALDMLAAEKFDVATAARLARVRKWAAETAGGYPQKRVDLARRLGTPTADGAQISLAPAQQAEFARELEPLRAPKAELDPRIQFNARLLDSVAALSPRAYEALLPFMYSDPEEPGAADPITLRLGEVAVAYEALLKNLYAVPAQNPARIVRLARWAAPHHARMLAALTATDAAAGAAKLSESRVEMDAGLRLPTAGLRLTVPVYTALEPFLVEPAEK